MSGSKVNMIYPPSILVMVQESQKKLYFVVLGIVDQKLGFMLNRIGILVFWFVFEVTVKKYFFYVLESIPL